MSWTCPVCRLKIFTNTRSSLINFVFVENLENAVLVKSEENSGVYEKYLVNTEKNGSVYEKCLLNTEKKW